MRGRELALSGALAALSMVCGDCEREGCDALDRRAPERGPGIGGVMAYSSDLADSSRSSR